MKCPKCGFDQAGTTRECGRCGVIFEKWQEVHDLPPLASTSRPVADSIDFVEDGHIGRSELTILGVGLAAAIVANLVPFVRFVFSALVTLFHELGHAVAGWLLGYPSLPAFDFVYGGGFTHQGEFRLSIAVLIAAAFAWSIRLFRRNGRSVIAIGALFLLWLVFVSSEWRRELVVASAGHAFEFILAGVLLYQALSGVGWKIPEIERPLGAFAAFFVQIHSMRFAMNLRSDPDFLAWYREGKGGALMNDLEVVALDLKIYLGLDASIEGVAGWLLVFSFVPIVVAIGWYLRRSRWHQLVRSLLIVRPTAP